jgi:hypothetical protein
VSGFSRTYTNEQRDEEKTDRRPAASKLEERAREQRLAAPKLGEWAVERRREHWSRF